MDKIKIYSKENIYELKQIPILNDGQIYIYVMLNAPQGNIKIGKTTNIIQRLQSLSGSNNGGNKIVKLYCSPATWMQTMEETCHNHFDWYRINGTEWFDGDRLSYNEAVEYVNGLFTSKSFELCNEIRKQFVESKNNKGIKNDN